MDKRGIRCQQAERMTTAENKVKRLRQEVADLRKQLFRAEESARLANEEAAARAAAQRQSGEALREQLRQARADIALWKDEAEKWHAIANQPPEPSLFQRIAARFGRSS